MKKVKRIFFILYIVGVFCLGAFLLKEELLSGEFWSRVKKNPTMLLAVAWTLLSVPSLFFNLEKLGESGVKSKIYTFTRISDLIFSIYMIPLIVLGIIALSRYTLIEGNEKITQSEIYMPLLIMLVCLVASILLFIDNIKYHKSFKKTVEVDTIDHIGKTEDLESEDF